jgi:predicted NBD/HSP70 family sugar kinase
MLQECHALCLAERHYGLAQGLDDFAMLEAGTGVGLGVMSGGALLIGHNGLAGEIGHITVVEDGRQCGCGNRGCLETAASDSALAWRLSNRVGRRLNIEKVIDLSRSGTIDLSEELDETCRYLAIGVAAVINLFNPATLFVHGRQFEVDSSLFPKLVELTRQRTLPPSFAACRIVLARGSKKQGAIAAIVQHLTASIAPALAAPFLPLSERYTKGF